MGVKGHDYKEYERKGLVSESLHESNHMQRQRRTWEESVGTAGVDTEVFGVHTVVPNLQQIYFFKPPQNKYLVSDLIQQNKIYTNSYS